MLKARMTILLFNLFAVLSTPAAAQTTPPGPPRQAR